MANPAHRQIALNGSGGAYVSILATVMATYWEAMEDEGTTTQGITVQVPNDGFATTNTFSFGSQPVAAYNPHKYDGGRGPLLGMPAQNSSGLFNYIAATTLLKARSNSATATTIRFDEYA
jgi:hypothetical protein